MHLKETGKLKLKWKVPEQIQTSAPACRPSPSLNICIRHICGVCLLRERMVGWGPRKEMIDHEVAEARGMWGADEGLLAGRERELEDMKEQKSFAEWNFRREYPTVRHVPPLEEYK